MPTGLYSLAVKVRILCIVFMSNVTHKMLKNASAGGVTDFPNDVNSRQRLRKCYLEI